MLVNNYDQNSKGINIEGNFFYDTDSSRISFEESFKRLNDGLYFYTDNGQIENDITFSVKGERKDMINYLNDNVGTHYEWGFDNDEELINNIIDNIETSEFLVKYDEKRRLLNEYNIILIPSTPIKEIITRGYSQGDYSKVIYFPIKLKELWGKEVDEKELSNTIHQLFWDCPIYGSLTINDEEFRYEEDTYEWEREKFIESVVKHFGESVREEVENLVPTEINY